MIKFHTGWFMLIHLDMIFMIRINVDSCCFNLNNVHLYWLIWTIVDYVWTILINVDLCCCFDFYSFVKIKTKLCYVMFACALKSVEKPFVYYCAVLCCEICWKTIMFITCVACVYEKNWNETVVVFVCCMFMYKSLRNHQCYYLFCFVWWKT